MTSGSVASHRLNAFDNLPRVPNPEDVLSNERPIKLYFSKILLIVTSKRYARSICIN